MQEKHSTSSPPNTNLRTSEVASFSNNILKTPDAAKYLNIRSSTLEQWRWNGRGPRYIKIGRSVRYRTIDLETFLEERVFTSTTESQTAS